MNQGEEVKCSITEPCSNDKVCNLDNKVCEPLHDINLLIDNKKFIGGSILQQIIQGKYGHKFYNAVCDSGFDVMNLTPLQGNYNELSNTIANDDLLAFYDPITNKILCQLRKELLKYWAEKENVNQGIILSEKEINKLRRNNSLIINFKNTKKKEYFLPLAPLASGTFILQKQKALIRDQSFFVLIKTDSTWIDTNPFGASVHHNFTPERNEYGQPFYILFPVKKDYPKSRLNNLGRRTRWDVRPPEEKKEMEYQTEQLFVSLHIQKVQKILKEKFKLKISDVNSRSFFYDDIYKPMAHIKNYWRLLAQDIKKELNIDKTKVSEYIGEKKNGKKNGKGYMINSVEPYYTAYYGEYKNDKRHGIGITEFVHNNYTQGFIGEWKNGKKNGYGYLKNVIKIQNHEVGEEWACYWKDDEIIGDGYYQQKLTLFDGAEYLYFGSWKNNFKNGKGIEYIPNDKNTMLYTNIGKYVMSTFTGQGLRSLNSQTKQYGTFFNSILQQGTVLNKEYFIKAFKQQNKRGIKWITEYVVNNEYNSYYLSPDYQWWGAFNGNKILWKRGRIGFDDGASPFTKLSYTIKELLNLFPPINNDIKINAKNYIDNMPEYVRTYMTDYPRKLQNPEPITVNQSVQAFYTLGKSLLPGWLEIEI